MDVVKTSFLLPTLKLDDQKFEFIFLIDNSGSMAGGKMELAKKALKLFLHSLPSTCYFNIITFNHTYSAMFPQSVKYDQRTLDQAKQWVERIYGDGGTSILPPLQFVYGNPQIPGYLTQIFSLTDGQVSDASSVLSLVGSKVKHSRAFSLGVGADVDRHLVQGIADNGGGTAEFVSDSTGIEEKILHQLRISLRPALLQPIRVAGSTVIQQLSDEDFGNRLLSF